jgi:hypothetical protein
MLDQLGRAFEIELLPDVCPVCFNGLDADIQLVGHLPRAEAAAQQKK